MINIPHEKCFGCRACLNICPKDAISMKEDANGYLYPEIDLEKCIDCSLCEKVCPELSPAPLNEPNRILAARSICADTLGSTASGGLISMIAAKIVDNGGIVYGCSQTDYHDIGHVRIDSPDKLYLIKNSKYVHSDIKHTYREAKQDLIEGKIVFFTGTPCQIAGLRTYLRKPYPGLYTADLVCHGVPPMKMLEEQVRSYPETQGIPDEDIKVDFRWKIFDRSGFPEEIRFGLRTEVRSADGIWRIVREENDMENPYMRCFQTGISLRENCLHCRFARKERVGDITAADFWGLGLAVQSEMNAKKGVSLVLVNTAKGQELFDKVANQMVVEEHTYEEACLYNRCLYTPFPYLPQRKEFLRLCSERGLAYATRATDRIYRFEKNPVIKFIKRTPGLRQMLSLAFKVRSILLRK